ncbi:MAG: TMEM43 family protein [Rhodanobacter sp.]|jgi:hypothetical protein|nr:TMEM43 family protein [Rhodanobacter sp.]
MKIAMVKSVRGLALQVVGALLVLAGIGLVATIAHGLIDFRTAASRHGGEVIELTADAHPQSGQHGYMARIVGIPEVIEAPHDPDFNLQVDAPILIRHVEMFQWREIRIGGSVHYEMDWVDRPLDASRFEQPHGHANPANFPIDGKRFDAGLVQMGGFKLSPDILHAMPGSVRVSPQLSDLPANLAASFSRYRDYLVTSARPGDPRLGDVRVSWEAVPLQQLTIVARIDGDRMVPAAGAADGKGLDVEVGNVPLLDVYPDLPIPPEFVLAKRILSLLLAALGVFLLGSRQPVRGDLLLAAAVASLVVGSVASVLWVGGDRQTLLGWLAVALLGLLGTTWRLKRRPA